MELFEKSVGSPPTPARLSGALGFPDTQLLRYAQIAMDAASLAALARGAPLTHLLSPFSSILSSFKNLKPPKLIASSPRILFLSSTSSLSSGQFLSPSTLLMSLH